MTRHIFAGEDITDRPGWWKIMLYAATILAILCLPIGVLALPQTTWPLAFGVANWVFAVWMLYDHRRERQKERT